MPRAASGLSGQGVFEFEFRQHHETILCPEAGDGDAPPSIAVHDLKQLGQAGARVGQEDIHRQFSYRQDTGYQAVRLPYLGGELAMYVFLPDPGSSLAKLLEIMNGDTWRRVTVPGFRATRWSRGAAEIQTRKHPGPEQSARRPRHENRVYEASRLFRHVQRSALHLRRPTKSVCGSQRRRNGGGSRDDYG